MAEENVNISFVLALQSCPNEVNGCPAIFPLSRTEEHAESCAFRLLSCSNEGHMGCGTLLTPVNRDEHNCYMELKELYNKQLHKLRQKARRIKSLTSQMSRQIQLLSEGLEGCKLPPLRRNHNNQHSHI
ncbi:RING finger protein 151-like [Mantella aurantiaca]